jgi:hypothetical protein
MGKTKAIKWPIQPSWNTSGLRITGAFLDSRGHQKPLVIGPYQEPLSEENRKKELQRLKKFCVDGNEPTKFTPCTVSNLTVRNKSLINAFI